MGRWIGMNKSIDEIIDMLNWNNDIEIQKQGIEEGKKIVNFNVFFQPRNKNISKNVWGNCAEIIISKKDKELTPYTYELYSWVQDLNWPGALQIFDKLKQLNSNEYFEKELDKFIEIARLIEDEIWLENLLDIRNL